MTILLGVAAWACDTSAIVARADSANPTDAAMARYAGGDALAFALVYDGLAPRLFGYLLRQTRNAAFAEDLVQQTFLRMHRARDRFVAGAAVTPWAFAIARRLLIDSVRRRRREVVLAEADASEVDDALAGDSSAEEEVQAQQTARQIQRELNRLPDRQRAAFELVKVEGLSLAEAAQVLGTTVGAVKLLTHRAYEALRRVLGDVVPNKGDKD